MSFYFENFYIRGNEILFFGFVAIILAIIIYTIFAVRKELKKW